MYNEEDQDAYYMHKLLIALIYDNKYDSYKDVSWLYDIDTLETFKTIISEFIKNGYFNSRIKNNVYKILVDGRNVIDDDYKKRVKLINETIKILNSQKIDRHTEFYIAQVYDRRRNKKIIKEIYNFNVEKKSIYIDESIYNDFIVLLSHGDEITEEEFESIYLPNFIDNIFYYESLNVILEECPSMLKNELFHNRVNKVLNSNKKIDKDFIKTHKKIKNKLKKYK